MYFLPLSSCIRNLYQNDPWNYLPNTCSKELKQTNKRWMQAPKTSINRNRNSSKVHHTSNINKLVFIFKFDHLYISMLLKYFVISPSKALQSPQRLPLSATKYIAIQFLSFWGNIHATDAIRVIHYKSK